jgi:hypothetical protein
VLFSTFVKKMEMIGDVILGPRISWDVVDCGLRPNGHATQEARQNTVSLRIEAGGQRN